MKPKWYLNSQQQLEKLLKEKKIVLDIPKTEAVDFLESKNYTRAVTPFKDLLIGYNFDNSQSIKTLNKRILREYNQGLRVPIDVSGKIEKNIILKHLKDYKTQNIDITNLLILVKFNNIQKLVKKCLLKFIKNFYQLSQQ